MKQLARIAFLGLAARSAAAQGALKPSPLGEIKSLSKETVGAVNGVRQLPDGGILVNDVGRRRLRLLGAAPEGSVVISDTAAGAANMYGTSGGTLQPYVAD